MAEKTILLAEDDPAHVSLIQRALARAETKCRLDVVRDGTEVIDYLFSAGAYADRDPTDMPALLLLDLKMPKMDGLQVLQVLRRVRGDDHPRLPPVVILTSSTDEIDVVDAYRLGAYSFIHKPSGFPELVEALRQVAAYWLRLNELPSADRSSATREREAPTRPGFLDRRPAGPTEKSR